MKISADFISLAYDISKNVYQNKLSGSQAKKELSTKGMNPNSASDYINDFKCMIEGVRFTRTLNAPSIEYFLENIFIDFGDSKLSNALFALKEHIEYYESFEKGKLQKVRAIYEKYLLKLPLTQADEKEQNEIVSYLKEFTKRDQIINDLQNLKETDPEIILINQKAYKRDNKTIAQLKFLRNFECQICGTSILKKDGSKYIEAAHIQAKNLKGREIPNNIILLCPNHHKEFDFGSLEIISHTDSGFEFILNGNSYNLTLLLN